MTVFALLSRRLKPAGLILGLTLLAAACSGPIETEETWVTFDLTQAAASRLGNSEISPSGLPHLDGEPAVSYFEVRVVRDDVPLRFNVSGLQYIASADGELDRITFTPGTSVTVSVPASDDFSFVAFAEWQAPASEIVKTVAVGRTEVAIGPDTQTVRLQVEAVLGQVNVYPALPVTEVHPGDEFDVVVEILGVAGEGYLVPYGDFEISYSFMDAVIVAQSERGVRLQVVAEPQLASFEGYVEVIGWVPGAPGDGFSRRLNSFRFSLPYGAEGTSIGIDIVPPIVTISPQAAPLGVYERVSLTGMASDDVAVSELHVFNGIKLVASTVAGRQSEGASEIVFSNGSGAWLASWTPAVAGDHPLTAIALDSSGNMSQSQMVYSVGE